MASQFDFVLDTNTWLSLGRYNDIASALEDDRHCEHRRLQLGSTLLLILACEQKEQCVGVVVDEIRKKLEESIKKHGRNSEQEEYCALMAHFVFDLLGGPIKNMFVPDGLVAENEADDVDDWITDYVVEHSIPLITNEGWGIHTHRDGPKGGLRYRAKRAGAVVYSATEWNRKFLEPTGEPDRLFRDFFIKFDNAVEGAIAKRRERAPARNSPGAFREMRKTLWDASVAVIKELSGQPSE